MSNNNKAALINNQVVGEIMATVRDVQTAAQEGALALAQTVADLEVVVNRLEDKLAANAREVDMAVPPDILLRTPEKAPEKKGQANNSKTAKKTGLFTGKFRS